MDEKKNPAETIPDALRAYVEGLHTDEPKKPDPPKGLHDMPAWFRMMREKPVLTLKEARAFQTGHGPLTACGWIHSSSGMMMNSTTQEKASVEWNADGDALLRIEKKEGGGARELSVYRVDKEVSAAIRNLIERENLAAWEYLAYDPSREPRIYDYSSSSSLFLRFDESISDRRYPVTVTVGSGQASQNGGEKVFSEFHELVYQSRTPENLLSEERTPADPSNPFAPFGMGMTPLSAKEWTCAVCGAGGNTGKFCPECGSPRKWTCPACGAENEGKFCTECGRRREK